MTTEHPITPPPELVEEWRNQAPEGMGSRTREMWIATQAARWGADQELEAICTWLELKYPHVYTTRLRRCRRPKPPSLKETALDQLRSIQIDLNKFGMGISTDTIRRALEQLND